MEAVCRIISRQRHFRSAALRSGCSIRFVLDLLGDIRAGNRFCTSVSESSSRSRPKRSKNEAAAERLAAAPKGKIQKKTEATGARKTKKAAIENAIDCATAKATGITDELPPLAMKVETTRRVGKRSSKQLEIERSDAITAAAAARTTAGQAPWADVVEDKPSKQVERLDLSKELEKIELSKNAVTAVAATTVQAPQAPSCTTDVAKRRRSDRRASKQPEKIDLSKYFQAGDIFTQDQEHLENQVTKPATPSLPEIVPEGFLDTAVLYQEMVKSPPLPLTPEERLRLGDILCRFAERGWAQTQALAVYINSKFFPHAASKFRKFFLAKCPPPLKGVLLKVGPCDEAEEYLFQIFAEFCTAEFSSEITRYRELVTSADLTKPHDWFPFTRAMKRKVVYHCGPTNSGKTYTALQRFLQAETGIYCCPLRLLAMEIYEKANLSGVYCSLHTGQERREVPFATHLASTVEMAVLSKRWSVAVIDEVQLTADEFRGWAWTKAFLALQADEVHLCGDPSTLELYQTLCAATKDEFISHQYERFHPLSIDVASARGGFDYIQPGDCVVAFSRKEIFQVKLEIEQRTPHKCCVVYGALPPETRTQQAKLFNDPGSGYDVLVASDAIGMGLNLNIRRVIFNSLDKFNGDQRVPIPASQVKQIAGRAGRRGSLYPEGHVTTLYASDIPYLVECMKQPFESAPSAGLFPVFEQLELFASQLPDITFTQLLDRFSEHCHLDGTYFLCKNDNLKKVAGMLDTIHGLSLQDLYNFCFAPVNSRDPKSMGSLQRFASAYSRNVPVRLSMGMPQRTASDTAGIHDLETRHQLLSMYLWLSQHFPSTAFPEKEQAANMASKIAEMLGESLVLFTGEEARKRQEELEREQSLPPPPTTLSMQMKGMRSQLCAA